MKKICVGFVVAVLFVCVEQAMAMYNPQTGRFLSRDPIRELGFQTMQRAAMGVHGDPNGAVPSLNAGRVFNRQSIAFVSSSINRGRVFQRAGLLISDDDPNLYLFVRNEPISKIDPLGLSPTDCAPCNAGDTMGTKQKDDWDPNDNDATDGTCTGVPDGIFLPACLTHDACYATCNKPKSACDDAFYDDLYDLCSASCGASFACNLACAWSAQVYYGGVVSFGDSPLAGDQSYSDLQDAACEDCCCD